MNNRTFDIIIYGATGFTGTLVAEYFAEHVGAGTAKWAIAGRNAQKLQAVKDRLVNINPAAAAVGIVTANSDDAIELNQMCASTKILVTTVGPYAHYGEPLVAACVASGTHYLDITGEPDFVNAMLKKYDDAAKTKNVLLINCCGFDSIPADAGAFFTASQLPDGPKNIKGYVTANGTFSGGTWASAINAFSKLTNKSGSGESSGSANSHSVGSGLPGFHYISELKKWAVPMPVIDPWMVKRSSLLQKEHYGNGFSYGQYIGLKNLPTVAGLLAAVGGVVAAAQFEWSRNLLLNYRKSGEGPSAEERAKGYFKITFLGEGGGKNVRCSISGGDPGYSETAKMLSESALTVLHHYDNLKVKGGVVTPAGALGQFLIDRLQEAGIRFQVEG
jgi:short subunit dehydrogenase-like uncharacterized protein